MARTVDQIIREQLGMLLAEVAILTARIEASDEQVKALEAKLAEKKD